MKMKSPMTWGEGVKACGDDDAECGKVESKTEDATMLEKSSNSGDIRIMKDMFHVEWELLEGGSEAVKQSK
jgi:hypothetical protein